MDSSVCRARFRGQTAGVSQGLVIFPRWILLVAAQSSWKERHNVSPLVFIPAATFLVLLAGEWLAPRRPQPRHGCWDWIIHLSGFLIQGALIPLLGYLIATRILPVWLPRGFGVLNIGWWGAFLLNFVFVDFLYYWQHRLFHRVPALWKLHLCHHSSKRFDIWITSRNTLLLHFLFIYFLINPFFGYLVSRPDAFFAGAMITASLDILRHSSIDVSRLPVAGLLGSLLGKILVLPSAHHRHHGSENFEGNYGANLIIWDRIFGTFLEEKGDPEAYGVTGAPPLAEQWLFPWRKHPPPDSDAS
jgi:sterol desaturase/sphingolipid hydroxylase (fatty acid hydroxylase superfamily)